VPTNTPETYRKLCLKQQTELRQALEGSVPFNAAIQLFLEQHAMLHSLDVTQIELTQSDLPESESWSFEDTVFNDMSPEQIRRIPGNEEHSVAWLVWHMARCEDITMNLLVAGNPQVLHQGNWLEKMKITARDTGNAMDSAAIQDFSNTVDIEALRAYRVAVGRQTRTIVRQLQPERLKQKVDPSRMLCVWEEGAIVEEARGIADYWSKRTVSGLLLMPASRHLLTHLNEAIEIKAKLT
jgi:hypothetical protein